MKNITTLALFFIFNSLVAQNDYIPTVIEGAHWYLVSTTQNDPSVYDGICYTFRGDTLINGVEYKKLYKQIIFEGLEIDTGGFNPNDENPFSNFFQSKEVLSESFKAAYREDLENRKIYSYLPISLLSCNRNAEHLLFDFNYEIGDSFSSLCHFLNEDSGIVSLEDLIPDIISGKQIINHLLKDSEGNEGIMIEGFGTKNGPFHFVNFFESIFEALTFAYYCEGEDVQCLNLMSATYDHHNSTQIKLSPNPVTSNLNLTISSASIANASRVYICDIFGKTSHLTAVTNDNLSIDVSNLSAGLYFLVVESKDSILSNEKFIKK